MMSDVLINQRYKILDLIGEGGIGKVYKAFDTSLERIVAVKFLRTENLPRNSETKMLKRFALEAHLLAKLSHPNIIKVTDYGHSETSPFLVMEYQPGGTLKELLKAHGRFSYQEAAKLLLPIVDALHYAHQNKIIHRDIKPSNILITGLGTPMLTDFGIAKVLQQDNPSELTGTAAIIGTPEYMAPEQSKGKEIDARADLYALGVVFYEVITGQKPFQADTPIAVMVMHARDNIPAPSQYVNDLPAFVESFIYKMLEKDPSKRYQTAEEVMRVLKNISTAQPTKGLGFRKNRRVRFDSKFDQKHTAKTFRDWIGFSIIPLLLSIMAYVWFSYKEVRISPIQQPLPTATLIQETRSTSQIPPQSTNTFTVSPPTLTIEPTPSETAVLPTATLFSTRTVAPTSTPFLKTLRIMNQCFTDQQFYIDGKPSIIIGAQSIGELQILSGKHETWSCQVGGEATCTSHKWLDYSGTGEFTWPLSC